MAPESNSSKFPKIDLTTFILSVSSAAFMGMGMGPDAQAKQDLELARHNIDLLELIAEKTRGNRTPEEDRLLDRLLFETRMRFCDLQGKSK